ncbi:siderophore-interacting protein [Microlunatus parietis]|uniref:NADPH-dependent ferric siderophore reductase n=1 Tax=Microlunatus parietis TaxID=682979 RepID=A0A7Y9LE42_9ACTN|nr:siderophore-interacting protein [Microlunatus parietis]NYE72661.1 NADPH-dependent ferric siderophore reductase [Microlunatus parietis]
MNQQQAPSQEKQRRKRVARTAEVVRTEWLAPSMVRVIFTGDDLRQLPELTFTDHYVKLIFPPEGAGYRWPFDPDELRETEPAERWPVTRTYTIRSYDPESNELAIDFVVHGDSGLAGPWAARAQPGDQLGFYGPGGAYAPDPEADAHLLVGDEAAIPAIAAALERLDPQAKAYVFLEVANADEELPLRRTDNTTITWVHRDDTGTDYGVALAQAVRTTGLPQGRVQAFVHGNAYLVRDLRRFLFVEAKLDRSLASISGYWRTDYTEDKWQSTKGQFVAEMEASEREALVG